MADVRMNLFDALWFRKGTLLTQDGLKLQFLQPYSRLVFYTHGQCSFVGHIKNYLDARACILRESAEQDLQLLPSVTEVTRIQVNHPGWLEVAIWGTTACNNVAYVLICESLFNAWCWILDIRKRIEPWYPIRVFWPHLLQLLFSFYCDQLRKEKAHVGFHLTMGVSASGGMIQLGTIRFLIQKYH